MWLLQTAEDALMEANMNEPLYADAQNSDDEPASVLLERIQAQKVVASSTSILTRSQIGQLMFSSMAISWPNSSSVS
jgi:hypothetical protein